MHSQIALLSFAVSVVQAANTAENVFGVGTANIVDRLRHPHDRNGRFQPPRKFNAAGQLVDSPAVAAARAADPGSHTPAGSAHRGDRSAGDSNIATVFGKSPGKVGVQLDSAALKPIRLPGQSGTPESANFDNYSEMKVLKLDPCGMLTGSALAAGEGGVGGAAENAFVMNNGPTKLVVRYPSKQMGFEGRLEVEASQAFAVPGPEYRVENTSCQEGSVVMLATSDTLAVGALLPPAPFERFDYAKVLSASAECLKQCGYSTAGRFDQNRNHRRNDLVDEDVNVSKIEISPSQAASVAVKPTASSLNSPATPSSMGTEEDYQDGDDDADTSAATGLSTATVMPKATTLATLPDQAAPEPTGDAMGTARFGEWPRLPFGRDSDRNDRFNSKIWSSLPPITTVVPVMTMSDPPIGYPVEALPYVDYIGPGRMYKIIKPLPLPAPPQELTGGVPEEGGWGRNGSDQDGTDAPDADDKDDAPDADDETDEGDDDMEDMSRLSGATAGDKTSKVNAGSQSGPKDGKVAGSGNGKTPASNAAWHVPEGATVTIEQAPQ